MSDRGRRDGRVAKMTAANWPGAAPAADPSDLSAITDKITRDVEAARRAGITSASFPSSRPIGSVLDDLSARPEKGKVLGATKVRTLLAHAEHFLLDEEAGARVVGMVEKDAKLIQELREFALRPYPQMTISLPARAMHDAERETLILLDKYRDINAFALVLRDTRTGDIAPIPGWYASPRSRSDEEGRTVIRLDANMPADERMKYAVGTYSMAIDAVMLFLNQKKGVHVSEPTPQRRSLRAGRPVIYFKRSTIRLSIEAPAILRHHFSTRERGPVRRHAVRGHFFHRGGLASGCAHRWARLDDHENAWECVDCDRRRFWRRDFERGDVNKGVVASRYTMTGKARHGH